MPTGKSGITINRSVEDVFAILTNVEKTGTWFPGNVEEHWTSPPPHGVGSTRHAVVTVLGRRAENDAVVTEYQPPHRAAMEGTSTNAPFAATILFAPDAGGTRVDVTWVLTLRGSMRILGPLVAVLYGRSWTRGLANLKRMMESGAL